MRGGGGGMREKCKRWVEGEGGYNVWGGGSRGNVCLVSKSTLLLSHDLLAGTKHPTERDWGGGGGG